MLCGWAAAFLEDGMARAQGSWSGISQEWGVLWWLWDPRLKDVEMCV